MNTLADLDIFARVVTAGSMSAAGRELGYSPAVISKRIRKLEERLGIRLRDADNGGQTQNWLWLKPETRVSVRHFTGNGTYWDEVLNGDQAWRVLTPGKNIRVHAGRDWDGTLTAHQIWTSTR